VEEALYPFELTDEQRAVRNLARDFALKEIRPLAVELDRVTDPASPAAFPWELVEKGSKLGLRTLPLPEAYGGMEAGVLTQLIALDQMARGDVSCAKLFCQAWKGIDILARGGTQDQKDRFLPAIRDDDRFLISLAFTEPDSGSDTILPYEGADGGMKCSAARTASGYLLNGMKLYISLGPQSKLVFVGGRTDPNLGANQGVSVFLVPKDSPGVSVGGIYDKVCNHCYPSAELNFDNVTVPAENLFGGVEGWQHFARASRGFGNLELSVISVAGARSAFEAALSFARERVQGGQQIVKHQAVALRLADIYIRIQACASLMWRAAHGLDQGQPDAALMMASKVFCSETATQVILESLEIFGGLGVMRELPLEQYLRDSLLSLHGGGTADVIRLRINRLLDDDSFLMNTDDW
jgi:alkylation response protein AidB-like acyl-CoA dehydrogenase